MKCPHCSQNIGLENPELYFVRMSCPNCGRIAFPYEPPEEVEVKKFVKEDTQNEL